MIFHNHFIFTDDQSTCSQYSLPYQDIIGANPTLLQMIDIVAIDGVRPKDPVILADKNMVGKFTELRKATCDLAANGTNHINIARGDNQQKNIYTSKHRKNKQNKTLTTKNKHINIQTETKHRTCPFNDADIKLPYD